MKDWIHEDEQMFLKGMMYFGLGTFAALPIIHLLIKEYLIQRSATQDDTFSFVNSLGYYFLTVASYLLGLVIYLSKFPEKQRPGQFDIWVRLLTSFTRTRPGTFASAPESSSASSPPSRTSTTDSPTSASDEIINVIFGINSQCAQKAHKPKTHFSARPFVFLYFSLIY